MTVYTMRSDRCAERLQARMATGRHHPLRIGGEATVVKLVDLIMILDLHRQGLTLSAIARRTGMDRKTVAKYVARGLEPPAYGPRQPRPMVLAGFEAYLRQRIDVYPDLTASAVPDPSQPRTQTRRRPL